MKRRPEVVAFDVIETVFSLEAVRARLTDAGLPGHLLETWFAQLLRDAFALDATGTYKPFREVAAAALKPMLEREHGASHASSVDEIIAGFAELDAHPDSAPAMQALRDAGVRVVTLTNGSSQVTDKLLRRAGLDTFVAQTISVDQIKRWKPRQEVYRHCAETVSVDPGRLALVAAHGWDIHGAGRAGLVTGYVGRDGRRFSSIMDPPDVSGATLVEVVAKLLEKS